MVYGTSVSETRLAAVFITFQKGRIRSPGSRHMISTIAENKLECTFVVSIERRDVKDKTVFS